MSDILDYNEDKPFITSGKGNILLIVSIGYLLTGALYFL